MAARTFYHEMCKMQRTDFENVYLDFHTRRIDIVVTFSRDFLFQELGAFYTKENIENTNTKRITNPQT